MSKKLSLLTSVVMVLVLAGSVLAIETLVVPQGTTHTVTGKEVYDSFEVAGTLIVEEGGELTAGLGTEKSVIDGLEAKVIVNGGVINLNSRIDVGNDSNATIIMNGGLFRIGNADSIDDAGDIKMPDNDGGHQRIILNGGLLWAHRCQMKFAVTDDAKIIVAGGEMRLDTLGYGEDPGEPESYDPNDWLAAGRLLLAEDGGYTELLVSPNTPTQDYIKISAVGPAVKTLVVPQGATHTVTGKEVYESFEVAGTLIVENGGELTAGLGTDQPRSTIDGLEAKVIVNGGTINLNSRINVGYANNATIIMNGGLFRIGVADSIDDFGDIKLPDSGGGTQRIILNGGLLWAHRCQMKFAYSDDAKIIVAGGEMRLDEMGDNDLEESYDPNDWLVAGRLELAEDGGYTELVVSPNTPTQDYIKISAVGPAVKTLVVPQGATHTVTGKEVYESFEVAGTLIVENGGELTAGLGTDRPRSTIDGLEAKVIVNGGTINLNSRINVGYANNATIIMNGGLFRIGVADSIDDFGDIKLPDSGGGTQRIILNGGLLWAHRCQMKFAYSDDAKIIVAGGEMRLDEMGDNDPEESYDPNDWLVAGRLELAEDGGYTELVVSPNTPTQNYIKISAIAAQPTEMLVVPQGTTHTVTGRESYTGFEVAGTLIVEKGGVLTTGLGTDRPRSTIDGPEAKLIVNGGTINVNSRVNVGISSSGTIIMNGGLFKIGNADSSEDIGDIKLPDSGGGIQRIILNGGLLWAHRCQMKFTYSDDAKIIVAGGEMRLDEMGDNDPEESYDPNDWLVAGRLELAEDGGYTELVVSPNTPTQDYIKISAKGAKSK